LLCERTEPLHRTPQQDNRLHHSFTLSPQEWEKAVRLFHERGVKIEELTYRAHGFFTGRELYFLDPSGNLLEVRDPAWTAGMPTLSFVYSKLLRHKVGAGVPAGSFSLEPDLAERWEQPDDTTYIFHLRKGVRWHNKPPVNGRELTAEDVKFTYTRFLTAKGNPERYLLDSVDRVEAVDRYTVKFVLGEPYVWLPHKLANALCMWIVAPVVVERYGVLKKPE